MPNDLPEWREDSLKRLALILVKLAVTGALLWYLVDRVDLAASAARLAVLTPGWALLAGAALAAMLAAGALRWRVLAAALGLRLSLGSALRLFLIGHFFGQALPAAVGGDAVRVWLVVRRGARVRDAVASVALDRLSGLTTLLVVIAGSLPWLFPLLDEAARLSVVIVLSGGAAGVILLVLASYAPRALAGLPWMATLTGPLADARRAGLTSRSALLAFLLSLAVHLGTVTAVFALARGLGLGLDVGSAVMLVPPVLLLATLPISLGGWGVREGAMAVSLGLAGIAASDAVAVSVLLGVFLLLLGLVGAAFWLAERRRSGRGDDVAAAANRA